MSLLDTPQVTTQAGRTVRLAAGGRKPKTDEEQRAITKLYSLTYAKKHADRLEIQNKRSRLKKKIRNGENRLTRTRGDLEAWREQLANLAEKA